MRLRTSVHLGMLLALASLIAPPIAAQSVPTGFIVETLVGSGLSGPHDFCFLPDGRILIAERSGGVKIYAGGSTAAVGTVPSVETGSERGLLSVCADPGFATNGWVYVWYSRNSDAFMHLDRYTCTGDLANPASTNLTFSTTTRRVIIDAAPDSAFNHNGGTLRFGPDGMLYLSIGDDASSCQAQNQASLQGMLLRMDVSGLGAGSGTTAPAASLLDPGDNPLSMTYGDFRDLMLAFGCGTPSA